MQIYDIYYKTDKKAYIKFIENGVVSEVPLENYKFKFKLSSLKSCPGYYKNNEFHKCLRGNGLGAKETLCEDCERAVGFKSAFFMKASVNAEMDEYLKKKHYLYLAYFEPGIIKVGTANEERGMRRLLEQDAQFYTFIDSANGFEIQKKEKEVSIKLNLTTSVKSTHKAKYLSVKPKLSNAQDIFESKFGILGIHQYPEIVDLTDYYFYPEDFKIMNDNLNLVGNFKGLRGRYLIIENKGNKVFDINYIIGRYIDSYLEAYQYQTEMSLFDL